MHITPFPPELSLGILHASPLVLSDGSQYWGDRYFVRFFSYLVSTKGKLRKFRKDTIVTIAGIIKKNPAY